MLKAGHRKVFYLRSDTVNGPLCPTRLVDIYGSQYMQNNQGITEW